MIKTYDDLMSMCKPEKVPTLARPCQVWQGGTSVGLPTARVLVPGEDKPRPIRGAFLVAAVLGKERPQGKLWTMRCGNPLCLAHAHLEAITQVEKTRRASVHKGKEALAAAVKRKAELGLIHAEEIKRKAIESPLIGKDAAKELGVSKSAVNAWRRKAKGKPAPQLPGPWGVMLAAYGVAA